MESWPDLIERAQVCVACRLAHGRQRVVFGAGNPKALLMLVGEAPGHDEDLAGEPFVGRAGELLTRILAAVALSRDDVFITNTVMCRPPNNRPPEPDEQQSCRPFLEAKLAAIEPKMVVTLGAVATKALLEDPHAAITRLRGSRHLRQGRYYYPTFHPAALLRDPEKKRPVWEDFKRIRRDYDRLQAGLELEPDA
ncbi:MAG: uracil-DNA glycosylase [Sulfobacillus sp.]